MNKIMKKNELKLKVKSLDYYIQIKDNQLEVGCQTIEPEDVRTIIEFLNEHKDNFELTEIDLLRKSLPKSFQIKVENEPQTLVVMDLLMKFGIYPHGEKDNYEREIKRCFLNYSYDNFSYLTISNNKFKGWYSQDYTLLKVNDLFKALK